MSIAKIAIIVGASVITAGSTAAVATRDKWLPKSEESSEPEEHQELPGSVDCNSDEEAEQERKPGCPAKEI